MIIPGPGRKIFYRGMPSVFMLDFACIVQYLPAANRVARVWHAFATVTGRRGYVSCCAHATFERGFTCIPRFGT